MYSKTLDGQIFPIYAPVFCKTRVPQLIYQCHNGFPIRIHYHTAVGLSPAPSSLSKINTRSKREGCEVTSLKGTRGVQARQDAQTVSGPWRKMPDFPIAYWV